MPERADGEPLVERRPGHEPAGPVPRVDQPLVPQHLERPPHGRARHRIPVHRAATRSRARRRPRTPRGRCAPGGRGRWWRTANLSLTCKVQHVCVEATLPGARLALMTRSSGARLVFGLTRGDQPGDARDRARLRRVRVVPGLRARRADAGSSTGSATSPTSATSSASSRLTMLVRDPQRDGRWFRAGSPRRTGRDHGDVLRLHGRVASRTRCSTASTSGRTPATTSSSRSSPSRGWLVFGPFPRSDGRSLRLTLLWVAVWAAWTLLHGALSGWYPYAIIDASTLGYPAALRTVGPDPAADRGRRRSLHLGRPGPLAAVRPPPRTRRCHTESWPSSRAVSRVRKSDDAGDGGADCTSGTGGVPIVTRRASPLSGVPRLREAAGRASRRRRGRLDSAEAVWFVVGIAAGAFRRASAANRRSTRGRSGPDAVAPRPDLPGRLVRR